MGKEENRSSNKMTIMGAKHAITLPNLFTYYEQDMLSPFFIYYYNNVYQGWHERWYSMMAIKKGNHEWFKETITIYEGKERLRIHNRYGWNFLNYLYIRRRNPKLDKWGTFVEIFITLLKNG